MQAPRNRPHRGLRSAGVGLVILGVAVAAVPATSQATPAATWSDWLAGAGLVVAGIAAAWAASSPRSRHLVTGPFAAVVIGVWIFVAAFFLVADDAWFWSNILLGILVLAVGTYGVATGATHTARTTRRLQV